MNFDKRNKKKLKKNILFWLPILAFLGSILGWLYNYRIDNLKEKHNIEIIQLNSKISSIERNVGDSDFFDVGSMFVDKNKTSVSASDYIQNGNFYMDTVITNWSYKKIPPITFFKKVFKLNPIEFQFGRKNSITLDSLFKNEEFNDYSKDYRFHQLLYRDSIKVETEGEIKYFNSSINVFVVKKDVAQTIFQTFKSNISSDKKLLSSLDIDSTMINQVVKTAKKQYNNNSSGLIFNFLINGMVYNSLLENNILELENIQKKSDIFYTKYSKQYDFEKIKIFETGEIFFAERNNNIYIVIIKIQDKTPLIKKEVASEINKWLFSLKFL